MPCWFARSCCRRLRQGRGASRERCLLHPPRQTGATFRPSSRAAPGIPEKSTSVRSVGWSSTSWRCTVADGDDKQLARISFDILGFLALEECEVQVETIRPGRTIELVEATVTIAGRRAVLARAWYISPTDTARAAGGAPPILAAPHTLEQTTRHARVVGRLGQFARDPSDRHAASRSNHRLAAHRLRTGGRRGQLRRKRRSSPSSTPRTESRCANRRTTGSSRTSI